jgi:hypothetical protein
MREKKFTAQKRTRCQGLLHDTGRVLAREVRIFD